MEQMHDSGAEGERVVMMGEVYVCGRMGKWETSLPYTHFCYESKTALKKNFFKTKKFKNLLVSVICLYVTSLTVSSLEIIHSFQLPRIPPHYFKYQKGLWSVVTHGSIIFPWLLKGRFNYVICGM